MIQHTVPKIETKTLTCHLSTYCTNCELTASLSGKVFMGYGPAAGGFLCDTATMLGETIKETLCKYYTIDSESSLLNFNVRLRKYRSFHRDVNISGNRAS
jgi:hypothetical protein